MNVLSSVLKVVTFSTNTNVSHSMANIISIKNSDAETIAVSYLKAGSVIAVPTDTVYGLACDATDSFAINKLYSIKCRNENKPLAICLGEISQVSVWASVLHLPKGLLEALLPGPVTLILNCASKLDKSLGFQGKVGIRIPNYNFIRNLACMLKKPLALTSANLSNTSSATQVSEFSALWGKIPVIFDGGNLGSNHSASTIVDLTERGTYQIVREGVACKDTIKILKKFSLKIRF